MLEKEQTQRRKNLPIDGLNRKQQKKTRCMKQPQTTVTIENMSVSTRQPYTDITEKMQKTNQILIEQPKNPVIQHLRL